jgi:hypothetical protein
MRAAFGKIHKERCDLAHNLSPLFPPQPYQCGINLKMTAGSLTGLGENAQYFVDLAGFEPAASSVR